MAQKNVTRSKFKSVITEEPYVLKQSWNKSEHLHQRLFRTQKFTPKVRDLRQIQCYQKCVIRNKFNTKKNKKHPL